MRVIWDVSRLCYAPVGLIVRRPANEQVQMYTIAGLSELLRERNFQVRDLSDILCKFDELEQIFSTSHGDVNYILEADPVSLWRDSSQHAMILSN